MDDASQKQLNQIKALFADAKRHHANGHFADAERCYRQVVAAAPTWADGLNNLGSTLWMQGKAAEAIDCYRRATLVDPSHSLAHYNLGFALLSHGNLITAQLELTRAIQLKPDFAGALVCLGNLHQLKGDLEQAGYSFRRALHAEPDNAQAHNNLGNVLMAQMRLQEAEVCSRRAIQLQPDSADFHNNLGLILEHQGRASEAISAFRQALALNPESAKVHFNLAQAKRFASDDPDLTALKTLAAKTELFPADKAVYVHFALGKALDDSGEYESAFQEFAHGNRLKRISVSYDEEELRRKYDRIMNLFNAQLFKRHHGSGDISSVPIFVLGMPRSGSTLVEQILASHRSIHGAGELTLLSETVNRLSIGYPDVVATMGPRVLSDLGNKYVHGLPSIPAGKQRITDKMPGNFVYAGLIHLMLPNAKIIHTVRDPADTCLSCFCKLFVAGAQYSYDLHELGRYYQLYAQLMSHWRAVLPAGVMIDISYESLVSDLEGQSRRLIEHCGLPWDSTCLNFHKNNRAVATPSKMNVREPIYRESIGRWRHYATQLQPLIDELSQLKI